MKTVESEFTEGNKFPGLIINQEGLNRKRHIEIRIVRTQEDTFQLTLERYNKETKRNKEFISINFDEGTTAQIYHLIGNSLGLVK